MGAAAVQEPQPSGNRSLPGAAAFREPWLHGMSGSWAHQGRGRHAPRSGVLARFPKMTTSPAFSLHDDLACIFKNIKQAKIILQLVVFSKHK